MKIKKKKKKKKKRKKKKNENPNVFLDAMSFIDLNQRIWVRYEINSKSKKKIKWNINDRHKYDVEICLYALIIQVIITIIGWIYACTMYNMQTFNIKIWLMQVNVYEKK